jgi:hypothetical protein
MSAVLQAEKPFVFNTEKAFDGDAVFLDNVCLMVILPLESLRSLRRTRLEWCVSFFHILSILVSGMV